MADPADEGAGQAGAGGRPPGVLRAVRDLIATAILALETRLELLSADAQEAGWRLAAIVLYAVVALFCLFVGTVLLALLIIVAFWDKSPALAVGLLSGFFLLAGLVCAMAARHYTRLAPAPFAATLETLARDREALARQRPVASTGSSSLDRATPP